MNARHPYSVLHSFSIKNILYDKMDVKLFYFHVAIYSCIVELHFHHKFPFVAEILPINLSNPTQTMPLI